ncbi:MAG: hypothetical protein ABI581_02565 [Sediminibacterium sp.]
MKKIVVGCCLLSIMGFGQTETKTGTTSPQPAFLAAKDLKLTINYFNEESVPVKKNSPCAERFAFDTMALYSKNMIFYTDLDSVAIMKLNYQLIFFKAMHIDRVGKQLTAIFSGQGYQVKFTSKEVRKVRADYSIRSGIIEISKNGQRKTWYVMGNQRCVSLL